MRLAATILDVHRGQVVGEAEFRGPVNRVDRLADSLTVRVLQELGQTRQIGTANSYGLSARSLGALRAFLQAEQFFRRAEWDSARVSYERALVLDSAFALASWRLGTVYWWSWPKTNDSLHRMYALRAGALNRGLSPRDSLLVLCDSITVTLDESELLDSAARENLPRLLSTAEALVRRYPTDPDAWYVLGEARFHFEAGLGVSDQRVLAAFEQVIALDSAYAPAYDHAIGTW